MLPTYKKKALEGLRRLEGLMKKVQTMIEADAYCPHILENLLAMHGHVRHVQGQVLESHLHTCAKDRMKKERDYDHFIAEVVSTIGLSRRS